MPYTSDNVLEKETPFDCLTLIQSREDGSYATELAKELGFQQPTATDILSALKELNILKKGKRSKAQYYVLDYDGIRNLHKNKIWELFEETIRLNPEIDSDNETLPSKEDFTEALEKEEAKSSFNEYIDWYLKFSALNRGFDDNKDTKEYDNPFTELLPSIKESTVRKLVVEDFLMAFMYKTKVDSSSNNGLKGVMANLFNHGNDGQWKDDLNNVYFHSVIASGNTLAAMTAYDKAYNDLLS